MHGIRESTETSHENDDQHNECNSLKSENQDSHEIVRDEALYRHETLKTVSVKQGNENASRKVTQYCNEQKDIILIGQDALNPNDVKRDSIEEANDTERSTEGPEELQYDETKNMVDCSSSAANNIKETIANPSDESMIHSSKDLTKDFQDFRRAPALKLKERALDVENGTTKTVGCGVQTDVQSCKR